MTTTMHSLTWDESWSTGVQQFDDDHKHLIGLYNDLFSACFAGQGPSVVVNIVDKLVDYAEDHFGREDDLFERLGYPDRDEHVKEHVELLKHIYEIRSQLSSGEAHSISNETLAFLADWIRTHTKDQDRRYQAFFNERGIL